MAIQQQNGRGAHGDQGNDDCKQGLVCFVFVFVFVLFFGKRVGKEIYVLLIEIASTCRWSNVLSFLKNNKKGESCYRLLAPLCMCEIPRLQK